MKLELTIADDKELRAFIKDQIKGMILNIAREEIVSIISKAAGEKAIGSQEHVNGIIKELVYFSYGGSLSLFSKNVKEIIRQEVKLTIREIIQHGEVKALL